MYQLELFNTTTSEVMSVASTSNLDYWFKYHQIKESLGAKIKDWSKKVERQVFIENPYHPYQEQYEDIAQNNRLPS